MPPQIPSENDTVALGKVEQGIPHNRPVSGGTRNRRARRARRRVRDKTLGLNTRLPPTAGFACSNELPTSSRWVPIGPSGVVAPCRAPILCFPLLVRRDEKGAADGIQEALAAIAKLRAAGNSAIQAAGVSHVPTV
jgi:hypothetical protein